jgi:hypothetical protein
MVFFVYGYLGLCGIFYDWRNWVFCEVDTGGAQNESVSKMVDRSVDSEGSGP